MNRFGVQLKHLFEQLAGEKPPIPDGHPSWGDYYDARDAAEGQAAFPDVTPNESSTLPWHCTNPSCGHRLME